MTVYRAAAPSELIVVPLDELTAVHHLPAGATHLLAEPAPQLIAALQAGPADLPALIAQLSIEFEIGVGEVDAIEVRLAELIATGLVTAA